MRNPIVPILIAALTAGCASLGDDLNDLAAGLIPKTPGDAARMAADMNDPDQRRDGIVLLSNATFGGDEPYLNLYREYAENDPDPITRAVSVRALARHGTPDDAELIASNLEHENVQVRWEAAKGLQRVHQPKVVSAMLTGMRKEGEEELIRAALARGLGQYRQDRVFQALLFALDDRELSVNVSAEESLSTLTGQDLGLDAPTWLVWYNDARRGGDPFAGAREYFYPTYSREPSFMERISLFKGAPFETPGTPVGLRPETERSTYEDDEEPKAVEASAADQG